MRNIAIRQIKPYWNKQKETGYIQYKGELTKFWPSVQNIKR